MLVENARNGKDSCPDFLSDTLVTQYSRGLLNQFIRAKRHRTSKDSLENEGDLLLGNVGNRAHLSVDTRTTRLQVTFKRGPKEASLPANESTTNTEVCCFVYPPGNSRPCPLIPP